MWRWKSGGWCPLREGNSYEQVEVGFIRCSSCEYISWTLFLWRRGKPRHTHQHGDHLPQQRAFIIFCIVEGCCSWFCCRELCCAMVCWFIFGLIPLILWGRFAVELWNCAWVDTVGVTISVRPPAAPLWRFGSAAPEAPSRSRVLLPTPGFAGDGGRGCAAFKRALVSPGVWGPRGVSFPPTRALADALGAAFAAWRWPWELCCFIASQPLPLLSFIQSYSPSSTSPVFLRACVNRSRR